MPYQSASPIWLVWLHGIFTGGILVGAMWYLLAMIARDDRERDERNGKVASTPTPPHP